MEAALLPPDYPLLHARCSYVRAQVMEGHLLTAGEQQVLKYWDRLSDDAAHVHSRLLTRKRQPVRIDGFHPPVKTPLSECIRELQGVGLIDQNSMIPWKSRLSTWKVPELREACKRQSLSPKGRKSELIEELEKQGPPQTPDAVPLVQVRHLNLFRRLNRTYLHNHDGDSSRLVLSDLGLYRNVDYSMTEGSGRFRNRKELRRYEIALHDSLQPIAQADCLDVAYKALKQLRDQDRPVDYRWRFSGHRFHERTLLRATLQAEKTCGPHAVIEIYQNAIRLPLHDPTHFIHRLALCLGRAGRPENGVEICQNHETKGPTGYRLTRTGRRLARKANFVWSGSVLPPKPKPVALKIPYPRKAAKWHTENGPQTIEKAVIQHLSKHKRIAFHAENSFWTTLFGLLFSDAIFAPIPGMLPSPYLRAPLDLGSPGFRRRRTPIVERIFNQIRKGGAPALVRTAHQKLEGRHIKGVVWSRFPESLLRAVCEQIQEETLAFIMNQMVDQWHDAGRGMPDLVVLGCEEQTDIGIELPGHLFLAEIKGPTDRLRDEQHWWLSTLNQMGTTAQLWHIQDRSG